MASPAPAPCMYAYLPVSCTAKKRNSAPPRKSEYHSTSRLSSYIIKKPLLRDSKRKIPSLMIDVTKSIKETSVRLLDAFTDMVFEVVDQPYIPAQSNSAPVEEIGEAIRVNNVQGTIPDDFPEGIYIRNGANPIHGGLKSTESVLGKSSHIWVEGEGMLHALYFKKASDGSWDTIYNNKYVQTETFNIEKQRKRPGFLPVVEGDPPAVLAGYLLNQLRFGEINKNLSNTSVFEHAGKVYSISENSRPVEIDIVTLKTLGLWDFVGVNWTRPFTSHPKRAPSTGELVTMGIDAQKPYMEVGVISADGTKILHKMDLKFNRCALCHDIGVTERYNILMDLPTIIDIGRIISGGSLVKYEKEKYARIGVMPRYGDANSIRWFEVEPTCAFHIINSFEDGDEVVMMVCRSGAAILPGPDFGRDKFEWFSRGFKHINSVDENEKNPQDGLLFARAFEWRLNMKTGQVKERYLTGTDFAIDYPFINEKYTGIRNKYGYAQVVDSDASSEAGMVKYGGLAKLCLEDRKLENHVKIEYHMFPKNTFCTGVVFVARRNGAGDIDEDDGWNVTFVHNEDTNISEVYIVDAKRFGSEPVAKITLPNRVPYGFHATFVPIDGDQILEARI